MGHASSLLLSCPFKYMETHWLERARSLDQFLHFFLLETREYECFAVLSYCKSHLDSSPHPPPLLGVPSLFSIFCAKRANSPNSGFQLAGAFSFYTKRNVATSFLYATKVTLWPELHSWVLFPSCVLLINKQSGKKDCLLRIPGTNIY
jgi:hypothetical protein